MHRPVLVREVVEHFTGIPPGAFLDATVGEGGHARALLEAGVVAGTLIGRDADPGMAERARARLSDVVLAPGCAVDIAPGRLGDAASGGPIAGALLDLGLNSAQIEDPARGFSFRGEGPLDMRFDPTTGPTAAEWLASVDEETLARVLYEEGGERHSRRVARAIVRACDEGRMVTTGDLARAARAAIPGRRGKIDKATRTFQAVRVAVNREPEELAAGLDGIWSRLVPGGRLAAISYHSREDRAVKFRMREWAAAGEGTRITRKPVRASRAEVLENPRSRSAKLRVIRKEA